METVQITVNGRTVEAAAGELLLDCLRREGVEVPTLCHHPLLTPYGGCRLCVVARRDGRGGLVPACSTPVQPGMVVESDPPEVLSARRRQLQLLLLDHRMDCPVCDRSGDCRLQDLVYRYGTPEEQLPFARAARERVTSSPVIVRDPEKCIMCGTCVRLCDEVQGVGEIGLVNRGLDSRVATMVDRPLDCEFCGQCVNACPVGALVARPYSSPPPAWRRDSTVTTCSYCSCGCQVVVETDEGRLAKVSGDDASDTNHGRLCAKGWLGWDALDHPERLTRPLMRRDGSLVEVGWEEAVAALVCGLERARAEGQATVAVGSARMTTEDAYLLQRLMRGVLGSPHVALGPGGGAHALVEGMLPATGRARSTAGYDELRSADLVLVLRADPTRTHPLVKTDLVQGARKRAQKVVLIHGLSGGLDRVGTRLAVRPGTEDTILYGLCSVLLQDRQQEAALEGVAGFAEFAAAVKRYQPEVVAEATGISAEGLRRLAEQVRAARKVVAVVPTGLGVPGNEADIVRAAAELMHLLGDAGGGVLVLGERANTQGAVDAGLDPRLLPGHRCADDPAAAAEVADVWGVDLQPRCGWSLGEAFEQAAAKRVGVLWLIGQDPLGAWPRTFAAGQAIGGAGMVVVQDSFLTATARRADLVLPVTLLLERSGTMSGADGRQRTLRAAVTGPPNVPQDGDLIAEVARRLGAVLPVGQALAVELERLAGSTARVAARFGEPPAPPQPQDVDGMLLDASPQLFHSGSLTTRSRLLESLAPTLAVRMNPADAARAGLTNGDMVRVSSGDRELLLRLRVDRTIRLGTVAAPSHNSGDSAAALLVENGHPTGVTVRRSQ